MSNTITVPAASRSVISAVAKTTFKVGTYTPLTDTFTSVVDLNDHVNYWLVKVDLPQPKKLYARTSTLRAPGERITAWNYANRHITLTIHLLYESGTATLLAAVRSLIAAIETPPYRLAFAAPNSTVLTYADVVAVTHNIPTDGKQILAGTVSNITIDFECAPGLAGDRIILDNLMVNPGFEAPSGPGVQVFSDSFANVNAYAVKAGSAPTVSANVMTIPTGGRVAFGSPNWGAINQWAVRWQATSGTQAAFYLHYTDGSNSLFWQCFYGGLGSTSALVQLVGGTAHVLSSSTLSFTASNWYWMVATQFPSAPGTQPDVLVTIYNDSAGAIGSVLGTFGPVATFDSVTALLGQPQMTAIGNTLPVGGAFSNVQTVSLFGPGAHLFTGSGGTGRASGAWEQNTANTYPGAAVTSYGAARIDCAPAGTTLALWQVYQGGAPAGTNAIPAAAGQTLGLSAYAISSGLGSSATIALFVEEYNASGSQLRGTTIQSLTGNQASWTQLAGTLTLGASTAYVDVQLVVTDSTNGSANATIWFDNAQCYNQTTTGQTVMPYCELRFPQSPAQLLLTGLQGDMPAPALMAYGIDIPTSYPGFGTTVLTVGQRASPAPGSKLVYPPYGASGLTQPPTLSSSVYGGYYLSTSGSTNAIVADPLTPAIAGLLGLFHEIIWAKPTNTSYSSQTVQVNAQELISALIGSTVYGNYVGATLPLGASAAVWTPSDAGTLPIPFAPPLQREDLTQHYLGLDTSINVTSTSGQPTSMGPLVLLPVDGGLVRTNLGNFTAQSSSQSWLWVYNDGPSNAGLAAVSAGQASAAASLGAWAFSLEALALPNPAHAAAGTGSSYITCQPIADPYLSVDPTNNAGANNAGSIAQLALYLFDEAEGLDGTFNVAVQVAYTPLYLYPRQS